jgi:hypothetical protein
MSDGWSSYLASGERVIWEGRPSTRLLVLRKIDAFLIPFAVVWTAFVALMFFGRVASSGGFSAIPFLLLLAGLYILVGRFVYDRHVRSRTAYALTNKRALIARSAFDAYFRQQPLTDTLTMSFQDERNGRVTFGPTVPPLALLWSFTLWSREDRSFTFRALDDAKTVYDLAQRIIRGDIA